MRFIAKELRLVFLASYSSNKQEYLFFKMPGERCRAFLLCGTAINPEK